MLPWLGERGKRAVRRASHFGVEHIPLLARLYETEAALVLALHLLGAYQGQGADLTFAPEVESPGLFNQRSFDEMARSGEAQARKQLPDLGAAYRRYVELTDPR